MLLHGSSFMPQKQSSCHSQLRSSHSSLRAWPRRIVTTATAPQDAPDASNSASAGSDSTPKQKKSSRASRMTSEELRARLLRNAQRTDAAKAGAKWQKLMQTEPNSGNDSVRQTSASQASESSQQREPSLLEAAAAAVAANDEEGDDGSSDSTRRLLRHYGRYSSRAARRAVEAASAPGANQSQQTMSSVTFWLQYHAEWGQRLRVIGSHAALGSWDVSKAAELRWNEGDRWSCTVELPAGRIVEYKYVVLASDGRQTTAWQIGNNSVLAVQRGEKTVEVFDNWTGQPGAAVVADGQQGTRETRLLAWADSISNQVDSQRHDLRRSRMELVAAQEEARAAREQVRATRMELAISEAERSRLLVANRTAEASQRALRVQLAEAGAAFRAAMTTAQTFLDQAELGEMPRDAEAEEIAAQAVDMILPQRSAAGLAVSTGDGVPAINGAHSLSTVDGRSGINAAAPGSLSIERHGESMLTTSVAKQHVRHVPPKEAEAPKVEAPQTAEAAVR